MVDPVINESQSDSGEQDVIVENSLRPVVPRSAGLADPVSNHTIKKNHGAFLIVIMIFIGLELLPGIFHLLTPEAKKTLFSSSFNWEIYYFILIYAFHFLVLYGILKWKKWVIYILAVIAISEVSLVYIISQDISFSKMIATNAYSLARIGIVCWAIRRKWSFFV